MSSVTLTGITKQYDGGVTAVSDVNLDIADQEFIILVGPSGCGKSTTLRMIAGLEDITSGELKIDGRIVNDVQPKDRDIAMVFQNYALYPHLSVFQNMAFGLKIRKMPKAEIRRKVEETARILEIEQLLDRRPAALSGGQRQRVALGRAIVRDPKVFLLDEPLSNLDTKLRSTMRAELSQLHRSLEKTFIYVTHDQTEAMTMGTRIVVLKDGIVQQVATPGEIFDHPANLFVATFMGSPQMNIFEGTLLEAGGKTFAAFGDQDRVEIPASIGQSERVLPHIGQPVLFGLRPTDIYSDAHTIKEHPGQVLTLHVEMTELLGAETNLILNKGGLHITAVVKTSERVEIGQAVPVCLDTQKLHLFDPATEQSIL